MDTITLIRYRVLVNILHSLEKEDEEKRQIFIRLIESYIKTLSMK